MLVSEMSVSRAAGGERTAALRGIVSSIVFWAGCVALLFIVLVFSSAILPSQNLLIVLAMALALVTLLLWRVFARVHSKAQIALRETLEDPPLAHPQRPPHESALVSILHEGGLGVVNIGPDSAVAGRMISELKLRTLTGASIVAIERDGRRIANPAASEELCCGDVVLLLGGAEQLDRARRLLEGGAA
jgi:CPA2 family monovalent cation:H+ antiporter-2